jgi:putative ABC transport system substrate-binding protein
MRRIEISDSDYYYGPFRQGMRELGYVEGKNLLIEWRSAEGESERLTGLMAELIKLKVDVVVTPGTPLTLEAQKTIATIPIVMTGVSDPVGNGLVKSLARPGGNTTGNSNMNADLIYKHLEMLIAVAPKVSRVAVLANPRSSSHASMLRNLQSAAQRAGISIVPAEARSRQEIENAFASQVRQSAAAIIVLLDPIFQQQKTQIVELSAKHRLPSIGMFREYAEAGGLMSYGANLAGVILRAATYVDKIFKGEKPGDIPVEQPTKFELFINGKTARALGLNIPQSLLVMADKVIE